MSPVRVLAHLVAAVFLEMLSIGPVQPVRASVDAGVAQALTV
jgi:hypothetical protein